MQNTRSESRHRDLSHLSFTGTEVLADVTAIQDSVCVLLNAPGEQIETVTIPDHTLYGDYLPKIAESEIVGYIETGEIVLSRVVVPPDGRGT